MIKRRNLLQWSAGMGTMLLLDARWALPARAQSAGITVQAINPDLALIAGNGGNVLVRKASNGELLAVDGGQSANAASLFDSIRNTLV